MRTPREAGTIEIEGGKHIAHAVNPEPRDAPAGCLRWETCTGGRLRIAISTSSSIADARKSGRALACELGFSPTDSTLVAAAIAELAQNIVSYAECGTIEIDSAHAGERIGLRIVARDRGPGIANVRRALLGGYSTSHGLGLGLAGVRRIMDEMEVRSSTGKGTTVSAMKWLPR